MDPTAIKIATSLAAPAKWLYKFLIDRTHLKVVPPSAENWTWPSFPVRSKGSRNGLLTFAITTAARKAVEITCLEIHYAAPLQLLDPGNRAFFKGSGTNVADFPFSMVWNGSIEVRHDLLQMFALQVEFPDTGTACKIRVSALARVIEPALGGFLGHGRPQRTVELVSIRLVDQRVLGIKVPPGHVVTTPQPFLIESGIAISATRGKNGKAVFHERMVDGRVSSTEHEIPDA